MKVLMIFFTLAVSFLPLSANELGVALVKEVPAVKKMSADSYSKLEAGFKFKGLSESPGHQAILTEMRTFYKKLKRFEFVAGGDDFPEQDFVALQQAQAKVVKLKSYVVMDKDLVTVFDAWNTGVNALTQAKQAKLEMIKVKKIETETKKVEKAIEKEEQKKEQSVDQKVLEKEARLQSLKDHYRFLQKQNRAVIEAGYVTPNSHFSTHPNGYYYDRGTFYPRGYYGNRYRQSGYSGYYPSRRSGSRIKIIYNKR